MIATPQRRWFLTATHLGLALMGFWLGRQFMPRGTDAEALPPRLPSDTRSVPGATATRGDRAGGTSNKPQAKGRWDKRTVDWERVIQLSQTGDSDEVLSEIAAEVTATLKRAALPHGNALAGGTVSLSALTAWGEGQQLADLIGRTLARMTYEQKARGLYVDEG